ncbi:MAG: hypothetical protein GX616_04745 [Planctomycetes bacterium]|nr:hypothetical protein [Planctomycetota bacterium]
MQRIAVNIETMADPERVAAMPEPEVKLGNVKNPVLIAEKIAEAKARAVEKAALDPHFARVLAIGVAVRGGDRINADVDILQRGEDPDVAERRLLVSFWDRIRSHEDNRFASFNGSRFDFPFLLRRSLLLGVRPVRIDCHPYRVAEPDAEHLDVREALMQSECGDCHPCSLQYYAAAILGSDRPEQINRLDQSKLYDVWQAGDDETIKFLCGWNVHETLRLAETIHSYAA